MIKGANLRDASKKPNKALQNFAKEASIKQRLLIG